MDNRRLKLARFAAPALIALALAGCNSDELFPSANNDPAPGGNGGTSTPAPPPVNVATATVQNVTPCLDQIVPGTGTSVVDLIIPDTITVDLDGLSQFPNGRRLEDPVVDFTLAMALLDLEVHPPRTLINIPLNPPANDVAFRSTFPFLGLPQGNPPLSGSDTATEFDFVDAPMDQYVRVDRTGMPALSPALVSVPVRDAYNDAGPGEDEAFVFADELTTQLTQLTQAVLPDFAALNLTPCAALTD